MYAVLEAPATQIGRENNRAPDIPTYAFVAAPILYLAGVDLTRHADTAQEISPSFQSIAYGCIEENKWRLFKLIDFVGSLRTSNVQEFNQDIYSQLRINRLRRAVRYLSTLRSDPSEVWVKPRDERRVQAIINYGQTLNL